MHRAMERELSPLFSPAARRTVNSSDVSPLSQAQPSPRTKERRIATRRKSSCAFLSRICMTYVAATHIVSRCRGAMRYYSALDGSLACPLCTKRGRCRWLPPVCCSCADVFCVPCCAGLDTSNHAMAQIELVNRMMHKDASMPTSGSSVPAEERVCAVPRRRVRRSRLLHAAHAPAALCVCAARRPILRSLAPFSFSFALPRVRLCIGGGGPRRDESY